MSTDHSFVNKLIAFLISKLCGIDRDLLFPIKFTIHLLGAII
jgi:hypothetical protein